MCTIVFPIKKEYLLASDKVNFVNNIVLFRDRGNNRIGRKELILAISDSGRRYLIFKLIIIYTI